jgi:hypothetical protein
MRQKATFRMRVFVSRVFGLGRSRLVVVSSVALLCVAAAASALATTRAQARAAAAKSSVAWVGANGRNAAAALPPRNTVAQWNKIAEDTVVGSGTVATDGALHLHGLRLGCLRARITADRGDTASAERLAREALEYAYRTDFPRAHAVAHETLAHVLRAAGRLDEARVEVQRADELWARYGFASESERTRALLAKL